MARKSRLPTNPQGRPKVISPWSQDATKVWMAVSFGIGSTCFLIGPLPGYADLVGPSAAAATLFVGSIFFTTAALIQFGSTDKLGGGRGDRWAAGIQFVGTLCFNVSTHLALQAALDPTVTDYQVWRPDVYGSICFLLSSGIGFKAAGRGRMLRDLISDAWRVGAVNLAGSIAFGVSAAASYVVPSTGNDLALSASNLTTSLGGALFLIGAILLLPRFSDRRP